MPHHGPGLIVSSPLVAKGLTQAHSGPAPAGYGARWWRSGTVRHVHEDHPEGRDNFPSFSTKVSI